MGGGHAEVICVVENYCTFIAGFCSSKRGEIKRAVHLNSLLANIFYPPLLVTITESLAAFSIGASAVQRRGANKDDPTCV
jgi:hypothetical protein